MKNNAIINGRLKDLLNILDARASVDIFTSETELLIHANVYELLANDEFMRKYGRNYYVNGLTVGLTTSILITKEA